MRADFAVPVSVAERDEHWDTILDLSAMLDDGSWVLVGGDAVTAHVLAHDSDPELVCHTADRAGRLVTTADAMPAAVLALRDLGFVPVNARDAPEFRFSRPAEDRRSAHETWTVHVCGVTALRGGDQALRRRVPRRASRGARTPDVPVPGLVGALVYEAAQFARNTTEPFVHARNAALLASLIDNPVAVREELTPGDRRLLRSLDAAAGLRAHHIWGRLPLERDAFTRWKLLLAV